MKLTAESGYANICLTCFLIRMLRRKGYALSPLLFNFALEYAIRRVQVNQDGLKLHGTHQLFVYANDINILGGSVHTINKNSDILLFVIQETGLDVNADKTNYVVMS